MEEVTIGEVHRLVLDTRRDISEMRAEAKQDRHDLRDSLQPLAVGQAVLRRDVKEQGDQIDALEKEVKAVTAKATFISGAIAALSFAAKVFWPWGKA